jgi:hypothetical protein
MLSLIALLLALAAFFESRKASQPAVTQANFPSAVGPVRDHNINRERFVAVVPLVFTNSGGRSISLLALRPSQGVTPVLFVIDGHAQSGVAPVEFFLLSRMIDTRQEWEAFLPDMRSFDPVKGSPIINMVIPVGETRVMYLAIAADVYERNVNQLLVALEAEFSHGDIQPIRAAIDVVERK